MATDPVTPGSEKWFQLCKEGADFYKRHQNYIHLDPFNHGFRDAMIKQMKEQYELGRRVGVVDIVHLASKFLKDLAAKQNKDYPNFPELYVDLETNTI